MKIAAAQLDLSASHSYSRREEVQESLLVIRQQRSAEAQTEAAISSQGQSLARGESVTFDPEAEVEKDPFLQLVKSMVEWMTGKPVRTLKAADLPQNAPANEPVAPQTSSTTSATPTPPQNGTLYSYHRVISETESTQVAMKGVVRTADGQEIRLEINLAMNRSYREEININLESGNVRRRDPLVINFGGTAAQLRDQHFLFDLDGNGTKENIAHLASGSGYLAFDRNGNGIIDNGTELFGPATNAGFSELAALDSDGNGWIDEGDSAFHRLSVWTPDAEGNTTALPSLASLGIGALYSGKVASPFELRGANNSDLGAVTATGLYLNEDGSAGTLQEVDLTV